MIRYITWYSLFRCNKSGFICSGVSQHFALPFIVARDLVHLEAALPLLRHCDRRLHDTVPHELLPVRTLSVVAASLGVFASVILLPPRSFAWLGIVSGTYARVVGTSRSSSSEVVIDIAGRSLGSSAAGTVIIIVSKVRCLPGGLEARIGG
ncbi:hypothetical protein BJV78DRAFT_1227794 [Lactifluus subvellereus]|nr:hypothetical protein BJV78DRAFT_1227794 [Lactifluus subvellereus]